MFHGTHILTAFQMEQEPAFRGPCKSSRISQGHGVAESTQGRETAGLGDSSQHHADNDGSFNPTTPSPSSGGKRAAASGATVEDPASYDDAADAEGAAATATHTELSVEVSYLEIYNESLRDLFNPATPAAAGGHGGSNVGSGGEWGVDLADSGGGGGGDRGCGSTGNGLRLREDPA